MKNIYKAVWLLSTICLFVSAGFAQKVGSTSLQFLHIVPSARGAALGDAYSVLASGADAVFWNPSGLALIENQEVTTTYVNWIFDTQQGGLSYGTSLGNFGAMALQFQYVDFGSFEETSLDPRYMVAPNWGMTGRTFHPYSYLIGLTYARSLTDKFSVGLSAKYAHESLFDGGMVQALNNEGSTETVKTWTNGIVFDLGVRYNTGYRSIQIAASVQNFGANVTYAKESSPVPLLFRFGIAANLIGSEALLVPQDENNRLTLAFDLFQPNDYSQQAHAGLEYEYGGAFALRAGYKFNYDYEGLTFGGGVKHSFGSVNLALDYSYGSIGTYLGNVQRISLGAKIQ